MLSFRRLFAQSPHAPRERSRSARRGAAIALGVASAVVVVVQMAAGWAIRHNFMPLRDPIYTDKYETLREHPDFARSDSGKQPYKLLFLGSSRIQNGINAAEVETSLGKRLDRPVAAFNFATPGAGPVVNAIYLRRLLADGVKPDAVVIEVHPLLLARQTESPPEANWFPTIRLRPNELPLVRRFGFPAEAPSAHGYRGWLMPIHEYRMPLVDRYASQMALMPVPPRAEHSNTRGFVRALDTPMEFRPKMLERARQQYSLMLANYEPGGCEVTALRDMLEVCRTEGIRAAVVLTPESSEFRSWYPQPGLLQLAGLLHELQSEFACPVVDCRTWMPDELFSDGHHLTGSGADAFTEKLTRDALTPWLASSPGGAP